MPRKQERPRHGRGPGDEPTGPPKEGKRRKSGPKSDDVKQVNIFHDEADWAVEVADDQDISVAKLLSPTIRRWLWEEVRALRARKARQAEAEEPPPPPQ